MCSYEEATTNPGLVMIVLKVSPDSTEQDILEAFSEAYRSHFGVGPDSDFAKQRVENAVADFKENHRAADFIARQVQLTLAKSSSPL